MDINLLQPTTTDHHQPTDPNSLKTINDQPDKQQQHDLSIKKEKSQPNLRKKQSQRFTVAHNLANPTESIPSLPIVVPRSQELKTPSTSSTSDFEYSGPTSTPHHHQSGFMSSLQPNTTSNFDTASLFTQFSGSSGPISRSGTNLSVGSASSNAIDNLAGMHINPASASQNASNPDAEDDIIPTAIVIKNIPFSVRREQLLAIIEDLMIPLPYAFNYHFDNGVFRGLAFANFRSSSEADAAVAGLNGFDISGRKLRVEYKKVLQAGEKERIEKEKAIKRMRSMHLQKESSMAEQYASAQNPPPLPMSSSSTHITFGNYGAQDDDHRGFVQNHLHPISIPHCPSQSALNSAFSSSFHLSSSHQPYAPSSNELGAAQQAFENMSLSGATDSKSSSKELDMNDPQTLELYSRVVVFKEDNLRDELAFSKALSGPQRRIVHQIAKKLGLEHRSEGVGDDRFVVVTKPSHNAGRMTRVASSANMSRGASGQQYYSGSQQQRYDGNLTTASLLRMKKSMPDMRMRELSTGVFYPDPSAKELLGRKSTVNLREYGKAKTITPAFSFSHQHYEELGQSPASSIGMMSNGNGGGANSHHHPIIRQPKGPEGSSGKGFGNLGTPNTSTTTTNNNNNNNLAYRGLQRHGSRNELNNNLTAEEALNNHLVAGNGEGLDFSNHL